MAVVSSVISFGTAAASALGPVGTFLGANAPALLQTGIGLLGYNALNGEGSSGPTGQYVIDPVTGKVTAYSEGGRTALDPRVTELQDKAMSGIDSSQSAFSTGVTPIQATQADLLRQAGAGAGGYVESVVNPVKQAAAAGYGALQQANAARGVSGSSFGNDALSNYNLDAGRVISDTTAKATQESLGLQSEITKAQLDALMKQYGVGSEGATAYGGLAGNIGQLNIDALRSGSDTSKQQQDYELAKRQARARLLSGIGGTLGGLNWGGGSTTPASAFPTSVST